MSLKLSGWATLSMLVLLLLSALSAAAEECPAEIATATKIILVTADSDTSIKASIDTFARASTTDKFQRQLANSRAVIGRNGLAWGNGFSGAGGQTKKVEGDGRTPAGLYKIGSPFGFAKKDLPGYLLLESGKTFCVDDLRSESYGKIVPRRSLPPETSGEDMRSISLYKHGLVINYPIDRPGRGGSCVFVHLWRTPTQGTAGCVAADQKTVVKLQEWANDETARIAIYSKANAAQFVRCLESLPVAR